MEFLPMPRVLDFPPRGIDLQDRRRQVRNERERRKRRRSFIIIVSTASIGCLAIGLCSFLAFLAFINYSSSSDNASSSTTTSTTTSTTSTSTTTSSTTSTSTSTTTSTTTSTSTTTTLPCDLTYTLANCDNNGGSIGEISQNSPPNSDQECRDACTNDPSCVVYLFDDSASQPCTLFDSSVQLQYDYQCEGANYMIKNDINCNLIYTPTPPITPITCN